MKILSSIILALAMAIPASAETVVIYHTSDVHGGYAVHQAKRNGVQKDIGGFAALSALVQKEKNPYLLLDSGDTFQGTPEGNFSKGMATVELMNQLGYSAMVPGNHDFDYGMDVLKNMAKHFNFPVLATNMYSKATKKTPGFMYPYIIRIVGGHKIAILGIVGTHTATSTLPANVKDYYFGNEAQEALKWVKIITKTEKPDAIIVLAHIGLGGPFGSKRVNPKITADLEKEMAKSGTLAVARAIKGYPAVIMGGHNHTALTTSYKDEQSGILLVESGSSLYNTSRVELEFDDKTGKLINTSGKLVELWTEDLKDPAAASAYEKAAANLKDAWEKSTGGNAAIQPIIKKYKDSADEVMNQEISYTAVELHRNFRNPGIDSMAGDWFADAMRRQSKTDIGVQNSGGVRTSIAAGKITYRDIYQIMPFDNTLVVTELTGKQVFDMVNDSIHLKGGNPSTTLQFSGLRAEWKIVNADGADRTEVIKVELCGKTCDSANPVFSPVDFSAKYRVATNNYLVGGGNGGKIIGQGKVVEDNERVLRDYLIDDLKANPVKAAPIGPRLVQVK